MDLIQEIAANVQEGYPERVKKGVEKALAGGLLPQDILKKGLIAGMNVVAEKFKSGQMFLPEVLNVAGAMKAGMAVVKPLLTKESVQSSGKVIIGTVRGDMHDIGKNLVAIMLEAAGFEVIDLGTDVRTDKFMEAVERENPQIVALSALLTTTMIHMGGVIEALEKKQMRDKIKVIVGGAPISQNYANQIKADGYARDASMAVDLVRRLLNHTAGTA
jgi:5-methyltetrahydrofolate--homocysteine methyltransferase